MYMNIIHIGIKVLDFMNKLQNCAFSYGDSSITTHPTMLKSGQTNIIYYFNDKTQNFEAKRGNIEYVMKLEA